MPLELLEQVNHIGPESFVKERIESFRECGVTNLQITPVGAAPVSLVRRSKRWVGDPAYWILTGFERLGVACSTPICGWFPVQR